MWSNSSSSSSYPTFEQLETGMHYDPNGMYSTPPSVMYNMSSSSSSVDMGYHPQDHPMTYHNWMNVDGTNQVYGENIQPQQQPLQIEYYNYDFQQNVNFTNSSNGSFVEPTILQNNQSSPCRPILKPKKKREVKKVSKMHENTSCSNCGTRDTKLWRRNELGEPVCNPCCLYERVNGQKRPENLWNKPTLKRRRRPVASIPSTSSTSQMITDK